MQVNITARHYKATQKLKDFALKKVTKLEKYFDGIIDCDVLLDYEKKVQIADISLKVFGQKLQVIEKSEDVYKSIEFAVDKLERQLKKYKGKLRQHKNEKVTDLEPNDLDDENGQ